MMSSNRKDYGSPLEWLSILKQDEAWLSQRQQLQEASAADVSTHRDEALRRIGNGETYEYWEIYQHQVEPVVTEVWEIAELSLPKLKIQVIGMLSMEWMERLMTTTKNTKLEADEARKYWLRLEKAGFVDAKCALMPDTTRKQAMYIAELFADRLGIKSKWKTFEQQWGISNLAQEKWDMQETGSTPSRSKEIDKIFED
ncbi:MAG: hypothetical protein IJP70_10500 [Bacteroidales bacterium]|nr:hypothetical protein [Bacteroidales bacterium]